MSAIKRMPARAHAAPGWLRGAVVAGAFLIPGIFVFGAWGPYAWMLGLVAGASQLGPYSHLLAYLLCVLPILGVGGWAIQTVGARSLRDDRN